MLERNSSIHSYVCQCDQSSLMDWVLDPVDDVELVRDIERVRSVGTEKKDRIAQFRYIKIQPKTIDLSTRLVGINPTNSVVIPTSLVLRSIVLG